MTLTELNHRFKQVEMTYAVIAANAISGCQKSKALLPTALLWYELWIERQALSWRVTDWDDVPSDWDDTHIKDLERANGWNA